jgi:hypothetical protein
MPQAVSTVRACATLQGRRKPDFLTSTTARYFLYLVDNITSFFLVVSAGSYRLVGRMRTDLY